MKKFLSLLLVSILGGAVTLGTYKFFLEEEEVSPIVSEEKQEKNQAATFISNKYSSNASMEEPDFVIAANKTVHAVVHVKNVAIYNSPRSLFDQYHGRSSSPKKALQGAGSGVIITPDGYIVTNNHVIEGASELEVTLNNELTYKAELIGTDPQSDIALIKIDAEDLDYIPFGNSDTTNIGDWVLAVGNPFNLTSTVTAGIISAKGRDLNEGDSQLQSFIQTDAAINPGNSGGALVNTNGELIGINTAISSRTGSYIGYGFAVPSNNARKIVEDILEYGDVQQAILGINGGTLNPEAAKENNFAVTQGVYVASTSAGAKRAGLKEGDLITEIDGIRIKKFEDLNAFIRTKRPGDDVQVNYLRNGEEKITQVELEKYDTYDLDIIDVELANASEEYLRNFRTKQGVRIIRSLSRNFELPQDRYIITAIDDTKVNSVDEVRKIMKKKDKSSTTKITFRNRNGQEESFTFRP